jgi:ubiquinone/menaquinone biosynthesis C-methylase UbiE
VRAAEQTASFDDIAEAYDELWSGTDAGYWQRQAVWESVLPLFSGGHCVLDIGCGTGVDALRLMAAGVNVHGLDASIEMVRVACSRGVQARHLAAEQLGDLDGCYDGAISNFGVLNCLSDLRATAAQLARLVKRGGRVVLCYMGSFCFWEAAYYFYLRKPWKAMRRWRRGTLATSLGVNIRYPAVSEVTDAFAAHFHLVEWKGIGIVVPPSYVGTFRWPSTAFLAAVDRRLSYLPLVRGFSDHRLLILERG